MRFQVHQPLDLALTLQSGQAFRWRQVAMPSARGPQSAAGGWWHGFLGSEPILLRQRPGVRDLTSPVLELLCRRGTEQEVAGRLSTYLRLDDDLTAIYTSMGCDPHLPLAVGRLHGMRLLRQDPWECLVGFLCSGQNNVLRISRIMERLAERFGSPAPLRGIVRCTFPTPNSLAEAGERRLRELGLGFRAAAVAPVARLVAEGAFPLAALREWPYQKAKDALIELPGVGEKIADCVLLFSLEKLEAFPVDRWVRRALEEWYPVPRPVGPNGKPRKEIPYRVLCAWAQERFGPLAGYANQYLFLGRRAVEREVGGMGKTDRRWTSPQKICRGAT